MQNKEIEGYIVPYDMPELFIKKGHVVPIEAKFGTNDSWYSLRTIGTLPASIVEKWDVKWKETEIIYGAKPHTVTIKKDCIIIDSHECFLTVSDLNKIIELQKTL